MPAAGLPLCPHHYGELGQEPRRLRKIRGHRPPLRAMGRAVWGLHPQRSPQRPRLTPGDTVCPGSRGQSCAGTFPCPLSSAKLPLLRFKISRRIRSAPAPHGSAFRPRPLGCWRLADPPLTSAGSQELCGAGERWGEGKGGPYSLLPPSGGGFRPRGLPCSATGSCVTRSALLSPPPRAS